MEGRGGLEGLLEVRFGLCLIRIDRACDDEHDASLRGNLDLVRELVSARRFDVGRGRGKGGSDRDRQAALEDRRKDVAVGEQDGVSFLSGRFRSAWPPSIVFRLPAVALDVDLVPHRFVDQAGQDDPRNDHVVPGDANLPLFEHWIERLAGRRNFARVDDDLIEVRITRRIPLRGHQDMVRRPVQRASIRGTEDVG